MTTSASPQREPASRADLHAHSKYSDRPSEWVLRRMGAPESFTEPLDLYRRCRERGMDFVTISDHNRIEGALEIGHLPGTFISNEVTTYFPEDGCKIHCLVFGISEAQFREIELVRRNIYEFRDYLYDHDIQYSVAHPLFSVNDRLSVEHIERLLVLFKRFEGINGARDPRASRLFAAIIRHLTPSALGRLADRHDVDSRDHEPWRKQLTGGSDDHGGLYLASAWTATPPAATVAEFLEHLRAGATAAGGESGSSLRLAHSFYAIAWAYYRSKLPHTGKSDLIAELFERFAGAPAAADRWAAAESTPERLLRAARLFIRPRPKRMGRADSALAEGLARLMTLRAESQSHTLDRQTFEEACHVSQELTFTALRKLIRHARRGRLTESLQSLSALGPIAVCIAPYLAAFHTQHKDARLLRAVEDHFPAARRAARPGPVAWFLDPVETTGVDPTHFATLAAGLQANGRRLIAVTALTTARDLGCETANFPPLGELKLGGLEAGELQFPPFLEILEWCERQQVGEIVLATSGPLAVVGLAAARLLGVRTIALYRDQLPRRLRQATGSEAVEAGAWRYLRWLYDQADRRVLDGGADRAGLAAHGLPLGADALELTPESIASGRLWAAAAGSEPAPEALLHIRTDPELVVALDSY